MDARYSIRKAQLLEECQVAPEVFAQVLPRLHTLWNPLSRPCLGKPLGRTPRHTSRACCPMSSTKTLNRSPTILARSAWDYKALLAGGTRTIPPCARSCAI